MLPVVPQIGLSGIWTPSAFSLHYLLLLMHDITFPRQKYLFLKPRYVSLTLQCSGVVMLGGGCGQHQPGESLSQRVSYFLWNYVFLASRLDPVASKSQAT
ncbi:hypothetical protein ElyMa_000871000 [Elysia marginata]|uniref:Uncharacterized protein n=1 Tax=Elysia marginata TaxID=1093978 RepID=A0AAV4H4J0_9GAST|nr:hypothetical protein ElyMa_000871000 [Elysia marginata]